MDNERKNPELPENEDWLDEILGTKDIPRELGADELAVAAAGLTHPDDLELERIVRETLAQDWDMVDEPEPEPAEKEAVDNTQLFDPQELEAMFAEQEAAEAQVPAVEEAPEEEEQPAPKKLKKKNTYGLLGIPHILATCIWLIIIVMIGVSMGRMIWVCAADLLAFGKEPKSATVHIEADDDLADISKKLEDAGLIRYAGLFELFADLTGKGDNIGTGEFNFSADRIYDYNALIKAITNYGPVREEVEIMFPEGYSCAQIFELLEQKGVCTVAELEEYAANGELKDYWFLEGVKRGHKYSLEGYLAPDTYRFYTNDKPRNVLEKFLNEFDDRFDDHLRQKFIELNQYLSAQMRKNGYGSAYIAEHQMTVQDVVIMASIIEKESANNVESYKIASVFYNRLTNAGNYPYLGSDATILYAENYYNKGEILTSEDRKNNPFNTYTQIGLPPSPIANPGLNSLGAALDPEESEYYYFVFDKKAGVHLFSKTLAEHERKIKELGLQ